MKQVSMVDRGLTCKVIKFDSLEDAKAFSEKSYKRPKNWKEGDTQYQFLVMETKEGFVCVVNEDDELSDDEKLLLEVYEGEFTVK